MALVWRYRGHLIVVTSWRYFRWIFLAWC